jgi:hypothetical protein
MNILKHLLFSVILSTVISLVNIWNLNKGNLSIINVLSTLIFLIIWFLYGYIMRNKNNRTFLPFIFCFWIGGIVLGGIYSITECNVLAELLIWIYRIPVYGLEYFVHNVAYKRLVSIICDYIIIFALPLSFSIMGYVFKRNSSKT